MHNGGNFYALEWPKTDSFIQPDNEVDIIV